MTHTNTFLREKRLIAQFEQFKKAAEEGAKMAKDGLNKAREKGEEMAKDGIEAAQDTFDALRTMDRDEILRRTQEMMGDALGELQDLYKHLDKDFIAVIVAGKDALMSLDPGKAQALRKALENLANRGSVRIARMILDYMAKSDPELLVLIEHAELAERALAGDIAAHQALADENLQQRWGITRYAYSWWVWGKGEEGRRTFEAGKIEERYLEELNAIVAARPYLSVNFIRKVIQDGNPAYFTPPNRGVNVSAPEGDRGEMERADVWVQNSNQALNGIYEALFNEKPDPSIARKNSKLAAAIQEMLETKTDFYAHEGNLFERDKTLIGTDEEMIRKRHIVLRGEEEEFNFLEALWKEPVALFDIMAHNDTSRLESSAAAAVFERAADLYRKFREDYEAYPDE